MDITKNRSMSGQELRAWRESLPPKPRPLSTPGRRPPGWTQVDLAEALDIHSGTVSGWESGRADVPAEVVRRLPEIEQQAIEAATGEDHD